MTPRKTIMASWINDGQIWVCDNCTFAHANGVDLRHESADGNPDDPEPWNLWQDAKYEIAMGGEHEEGCPNRDTQNGMEPGVCLCETRDYSSHPCGGCGNPLDGRRSAFTWFQMYA